MRVVFLLTLMVASVGVAWGEAVFPDAFWGEGRRTGDNLWIDVNGWARWEFYSVPSAGHRVSLDIMVWLREPGPQQLPVCLRASTPALDHWRTLAVTLAPYRRDSGFVLYHSRLWLSRHDFRLGSRLSLVLFPQISGLEMCVSQQSAALGHGETVGRRGVSGAGAQLGLVTEPSPSQARWIPETIGTGQRFYLSPGVYLGEVGALVPGHYPDPGDWLWVNLLPGQVLRIRLVGLGGRCGLSLYDPGGSPQVVMEPSSQLGLEYRAHRRGAWQLRIVCVRPSEGVRYRLEVSIDG